MNKIDQLPSKAFFLLITTVLIISWLPGLFIHVFNVDETIHATGGWMWANGGKPYIDFVDNKPPLTWLFYCLITGTFGLDLRIVHAFIAVIVGLTILTVYHTVKPISKSGARWAVLLYVFLSPSYRWPDMLAANSEILFNLPVALALLAYVRGSERRGPQEHLLMYGAGLLVGIGLWIKVQAGVILLAFALHLLLSVTFMKSTNGLCWKSAIQRFSFILLGFFTIALAMFGWAAQQGILKEFTYWVFTYNLGYINSDLGFFSNNFHKLFVWIGLGSLLAWIGCIYAVKVARHSEEGHKIWLFLIFALVVFLPVQMGGRFFPHYFIQFYPGLFAAGGIGLAYLASTFKSARPTRWLKVLILALLVLPLISSQIYGAISYKLGLFEEARYYWPVIGRYVNEHTMEDDRIFVWGEGSSVYYWSKRMAATKFIHCATNITGYPSSNFLLQKGIVPPIENYIRQADRDSLLAQLRKQPPEMIVDISTSNIRYSNFYPLDIFPELKAWITLHYRLETHISEVAIWRRIVLTEQTHTSPGNHRL